MNNKKEIIPICCKEDSKWVENVPGKGYFYCKHCKNEVLTPVALEEAKTSDSLYDIDLLHKSGWYF